jgi:hypothetical protein
VAYFWEWSIPYRRQTGIWKINFVEISQKASSDYRTLGNLGFWKTVVIATFFFWEPGNEMENSIHGLVRTLLYDILKQCPELISLVFPDQWQEAQGLPWQAHVELRLDPDQIYNAFRRLISCRNSN